MQEWLQKMSGRLAQTAHSTQAVSLDQWRFLGRRIGRWLFALLIGLGFALIGPYGTYLVMPLEMRVIYWEGVILFGFGVWWGLEAISVRLLQDQPYVVQEASVIIPFAAINSAMLTGLHTVLNAYFSIRIPTVWLDFFQSHIVLSCIVILPAIILARRLMIQVETRAGGDAIYFLTERLPPKLRGTTPFALSAEGHYVRVYTPAGDDLVTIKFEDAVRALVGLQGIQTHRSWWIALSEISEIKPLGSAYEAILTSGLKVPISRRRKPDVSRAMSALKTGT